MHQLRKGEHSTHSLDPTFFLTHICESSSLKFLLAGVVWLDSLMRENFARKLQE